MSDELDRWEGICPKCEQSCTFVWRLGYIDSECLCYLGANE
jgi:hypothetical protein